jgi:endogenous inhibitor of DNA gyrase (YacG/DUF329 family)
MNLKMPTAGQPEILKNAVCPQCGQLTSLDQGNAWRPFCSQRCKLLDLGEWFSGSYAVAADQSEAAADQEDGLLQ